MGSQPGVHHRERLAVGRVQRQVVARVADGAHRQAGAAGEVGRLVVSERVAPSELVAVGDALAGHPEIVFAAAITGPTSLLAIAVCRNTTDFYGYLTGRIGALTAVQHVETAPVISSVKRAGSVIKTR